MAHPALLQPRLPLWSKFWRILYWSSREYSFQIWIRRLGPNYLDRLRRIEAVGWRFGLPLEECGPETHIAAVLPMALEMQPELAEADSAVI